MGPRIRMTAAAALLALACTGCTSGTAADPQTFTTAARPSSAVAAPTSSVPTAAPTSAAPSAAGPAPVTVTSTVTPAGSARLTPTSSTLTRTVASTVTVTTTKPATTKPVATGPDTTDTATTKPATSAAASTPTSFPVPAAVGDATQLITVAAPDSGSTDGTLTAWQFADGSWRRQVGPVHAYLGSEGVGPSSEYHSRTPEGTFTLTESFGRETDPGSGLPYLHLTGDDWWVSDVSSPLYNTQQRCAPAACTFDTDASERLAFVDPEYDYAVVIDANRDPVVPGAGSAFFLHVANGAPTAGCVAVEAGTLLSIMKWLDPAQHPRIAIGVG